MYSDDDLLPLSGLQHLAYCERQYALIHLEQSWEESVDTLRGEFFHERVDAVGYTLADGVRAERRVRLTSYELGLYGLADIVEFSESANKTFAAPVEYKVGRPKRKSWDRVQVAAQAMCLEEMYGLIVDDAFLFYGATRRRERVRIDEKLRKNVIDLAQRMHEIFDSRLLPRTVTANRCGRCSLVDTCMPRAIEMDVQQYWEEMEEGPVDEKAAKYVIRNQSRHILEERR